MRTAGGGLDTPGAVTGDWEAHVGELRELRISEIHAQVLAYLPSQGWARVPGKYERIAHLCRVGEGGVVVESNDEERNHKRAVERLAQWCTLTFLFQFFRVADGAVLFFSTVQR